MFRIGLEKKNTFSLAIKTDTYKDSSGMGIVNVEVAFDRKQELRGF